MLTNIWSTFLCDFFAFHFIKRHCFIFTFYWQIDQLREEVHKRDVELEQLRKRVYDLENAHKTDLLERIKADMQGIGASTSKCLLLRVCVYARVMRSLSSDAQARACL